MNPDNTTVATPAKNDNDNDDIELMQHLVNDNNSTTKKKVNNNNQEGLFQRIMQSLDERCNVKMLMRLWGPRLECVVRLMLVATFLDDSYRTATHFSGLAKQIAEQGCLKYLAAVSAPLNLFSVVASVVFLLIGLVVQSVGSLCLVAVVQPDIASKALIGWTIAQPILFGQVSNMELVAESLSLLGGLLMLRAHLVFDKNYSGAQTQLIGRLLLPAMSLYYTGNFLMAALTLDENSNIAVFIASLSMFAINTIMLVGLAISSTFVAFGLKSRLIALLLAVFNIGYIFYTHPFFRFISLDTKTGQWKYDEDNMTMPHVTLAKGVTAFDFNPEQVYDLHKYYFFLGLSTSGALLLLARYGPGEIAAQKDEVLLPVVTRAQD